MSTSSGRGGSPRGFVRVVVVMGVMATLLAACDWAQFRNGPTHSGTQIEGAIDKTNVSTLVQTWTGATGGVIFSSPSVAGGVAYIGSDDNKLYAFDADGVTGCSGTPKVCAPLWTANTGGALHSVPAVVDGVVYIGSYDGSLYAFDADGVTGCSGIPKVCAPLWTAGTGGSISASPTVVDGVVYIGSFDAKFYAFDAAGVKGCSGSPKSCAPLWTATLSQSDELVIRSSAAVADGVVYVGSYGDDNRIWAFDAAGKTRCSGRPKSCAPLWTAPVNNLVSSSPAVVDGVVYVGAFDQKLYAFDAAGVTGCSGRPKSCAPLWTGPTGGVINSSPAVSNGFVYIGTFQFDNKLYAFDAAGVSGCSGIPKVCTPRWTATTGNYVESSPAVANGLVYVGSGDHNLYAYDANGVTGCSGTPKACTPLWTATTGSDIRSSPAVANGFVYIGSTDGVLYAYHRP